MQDPVDATAHALTVTGGRDYDAALLLSRVLHPLTLGIASFALLGLVSTDDWRSGLLWALLGVALLIVPPTFFFTWRLRQGAYTDEDVSNRSQRHELYLFSIVNLLLGAALLVLLGAPLPFLAMLASGLVVSLVAGVVNLFWKISVHGSSAASFATLASLYLPAFGALAWVGAVAVGWARVRTRNHTALQVLAGFVVAAASVVLVFRLFGLP